MAWNKWKDTYVSDATVELLEDKLVEEIYASELVDAILCRMSIDEKAAFLMDIASDYDIEIEEIDE